MFTMYQLFAVLAKGEVITATSNGFGHAQARAEIMRFINYKQYPEIVFSEKLITTYEEGKVSALKGSDAAKFEAHWGSHFDEMARSTDNGSVKPISVRQTSEQQETQKIVNQRVIARLTLELSIVPSVEAQRAEAQEREAQKKITAEKDAYNREIAHEKKKFVDQLRARRDVIEETAQQSRAKQAAMDVIRNAEIEATKLAEAEKNVARELPTLDSIAGKGYRELEAFVRRISDLQAQGKPLSKKDEEMCQFVAKNIVAPFNLPKAGGQPPLAQSSKGRTIS